MRPTSRNLHHPRKEDEGQCRIIHPSSFIFPSSFISHASSIILRHSSIILFLSIPASAPAQISPGELSRAHSSLEGPLQCVNCHTFGAGRPQLKCLGCHTEIRERQARLSRACCRFAKKPHLNILARQRLTLRPLADSTPRKLQRVETLPVAHRSVSPQAEVRPRRHQLNHWSSMEF
jgi:hypothetical protein